MSKIQGDEPSSDASVSAATAADVTADPAYHDGFFDAQRHEPLFPGASAAYEAGWRAFWEVREILREFKESPDGTFTRRMEIPARSAAGQSLTSKSEDGSSPLIKGGHSHEG